MAREALKKIVVFGGNGFVGSEVLKRLSTVPTVQAISVSRRGAAPSHCADFADRVEWRTGDCLDKKTYSDALEGASAVVVSVGSPPLPGDVATARRANGETNVKVIEAAMEAKVKRAVVVGATMPPWLDKIAEGYVAGKRDAFEALGGFALSGGAVVVKPSATLSSHGGIVAPTTTARPTFASIAASMTATFVAPLALRAASTSPGSGGLPTLTTTAEAPARTSA